MLRENPYQKKQPTSKRQTLPRVENVNIDFAKNPEDLITLFEIKKDAHEFYQDFGYRIASGTTTIIYKLRHSLIERGQKPSNKKRKLTRTEGRHFEVYDLCGDNEGAGCFGSIYHSIGTLIYTPNHHVIFKPKNKRILKKFEENYTKDYKKENLLNDIQAEYTIGSAIDHLNMKPPIDTKLVMDYLPNCDLTDIINDDKTGIVKLTLKERFMYAIAVLDALHEQFHKQKIIHGDVKPDNIRVEPKNIILKFTDVGFSERFENKKTKFRGSKMYLAPEVLKEMQYNEMCDLYATARIIAELFGFDADKHIIEEQDILNEFKNGMRFDEIFNNIPELEENYRVQVMYVLHMLSRIDFNKRPSAAEARDMLKEIFANIENEFIEKLNEKLHAVKTELTQRQKYSRNVLFQGDYDQQLLIQRFALEKLIRAVSHHDKTICFSADEIAYCCNNRDMRHLIREYGKKDMLPEAFLNSVDRIELQKSEQKEIAKIKKGIV